MKIYSFVKRAGVFSFNKQESIVFNAIRNLGSGTLEEIANECLDLGLKTKQDPERIVSYYMVSLKKLGLVESSGTNNKKIQIVIE